MKILMLSDRLRFGGAETHLLTLCRVLAARGHSITVASAGGPFLPRLREAGLLHVALPFFPRTPYHLARARGGLARLLSDGGFDLVHAHARMPATLVSPLCRKRGIPLVTTAHWVFASVGWRGRYSRWGNATLAVSEDIAEYLEKEYALPREKITLTHNGIDTAAFAPRAGVAAEERAGRILHVSRLDDTRVACARALIRLAPRLAAGGVCRGIRIAGEGECLSSVRAAAEAANREIGQAFVEVLGACRDVPRFLGQGELFVGVSRAALEAMACGLPVILAGNEGYGGILEAENAARAARGNFCCRGMGQIEDGRLFEDLSALLADGERRAQLGAWGRGYIEAHFGVERMADDAEAAYRQAQNSTDFATHGCPETEKTHQKRRMTVAGYYGFGNMGDEAVLSSLLTRLRAEGVWDITVIGGRGIAERTGGPDLHYISRWAHREIGKALQESELFLLGGGNLLQDETSRLSLLYYTHLLSRAKRAGARAVLLGGIGPLSPWGERHVRAALPILDGALMRTPADLARLTALAPALPAQLLPDTALTLSPPTRHAGGRYFALAVRGGEAGERETAQLVPLALSLEKETGLSPLLLCMHPARDRPYAEFLAAKMHHPPLYLARELSDTLSVLAECRFLLSARLHPLIFAALCGIPALFPKTGGKMRDFLGLARTAEDRARQTSGVEGRALLAYTEKNKGEAKKFLKHPASPSFFEAYLTALREGLEGFSFAEYSDFLSTHKN